MIDHHRNLDRFFYRKADSNAQRANRSDAGKIFYVPPDKGNTQNQIDNEIHYFEMTLTPPIQYYAFNIYKHEINMADLFTVINDDQLLIVLTRGETYL
jgi:hypothetical protein